MGAKSVHFYLAFRPICSSMGFIGREAIIILLLSTPFGSNSDISLCCKNKSEYLYLKCHLVAGLWVLYALYFISMWEYERNMSKALSGKNGSAFPGTLCGTYIWWHVMYLHYTVFHHISVFWVLAVSNISRKAIKLWGFNSL